MPRRSAGFVSKKPHKKSRGGCLTCKKKKVKCDEIQPACGYCSLRKLDCTYPPEPKSPHEVIEIQRDKLTDFNDLSFLASSSLVPAVHTSSGQLTQLELGLLHLYKTSVWKTLSFRREEQVHVLNRDWVPVQALSKDYLLNSIFAMTAAHTHVHNPDPKLKTMSLVYRQKALGAYSKALENISDETYETLLITATYAMTMVPAPEPPCDDATVLKWTNALFSVMQGLRVLAGLKWAAGIEKLTVYPLFRREIRRLPPPPPISVPPDPNLFTNADDFVPGADPTYPNPAPTYFTPPATPHPPTPPQPQSSGMDMRNLPFEPLELMSARKTNLDKPLSWKAPIAWQIPSPAFLPPPLMALLKSLVDPLDGETGTYDQHSPALVPALHGFSPIFLSLYYYHLGPDANVRIFVLPTFLTPQFYSLAAEGDPRALIIVGWWFALIRLIPNLWWLNETVPRVLQAVSNTVMRCNDKMLMDAMEGAYRLVKDVERKGIELAAKSLFDGWEGVIWEEGPTREQRWRFEEVIDLDDGMMGCQ